MDEALAALIRIRGQRQKTADLDGSPDYTWAVPVTAAGGTNMSIIEVASEFPASRKYEPLDYVEISNDDTVNVTLILNGTSFNACPSGSMRIKPFKGIRQVAVRNDDALVDTTLNQIYVTLRRLPLSADEAARRNYYGRNQY